MKRASLNHTYRLIWNDRLNAFVAVAENARARGKRTSQALALSMGLLIGMSGKAHAVDPNALPTGGQVVAGGGVISQNGSQMTVTQSTERMVSNWNTFNIGAQAGVQFQQPSSNSVALNRVLDSNPSHILGNLSANGRLFLVNPNGIIFGSSAQVNVGGIVASSLGITNDDFMAGRYRFSNGGNAGRVENHGTLNAAGGVVALIAPQVSNSGTISANGGSVALAAGDKVSLDFVGDGLVTVNVDQAAFDALAENKGLVQADGGVVTMTAKSANALLETVVNNDGVVQARSLESKNGRIVLDGGDSGVTQVAGTLDVSSSDGKGGNVVVTGDKVLLTDNARIDASGKTGGGEAYVGGGWQGKDPAIHNASAVVMQENAAIDVSAKQTGNGGTAVLWANDTTRALGSGNITARGGAVSGNGGKVETSGKEFLQVGGAVDASAANGQAGLWLLDPRNVTIQSSGATGTLSSGTFTPASDDSIIAPGTITAALNSGTDVTITTGSTGTQDGDITVADAISASASNRTLTLQAHNDININAAISNSGGRLSVMLKPDSDGSGAGDVSFGAAGSVATNGGNFSSGNISGETVSARGQDFTMTAGSYINTGTGGRLYINQNGTVTLDANSLRSTNEIYYTNGGSYTGTYNSIRVQTAGNIVTTNTSASTPDILTSSDVYLQGANIGASTSGEQIKISGPSGLATGFTSFPSFGKTLTITNSSGNSYVNEMGNQVFATVAVNIGSQASKTQNIQIMGDAGGDGTSGTGHIILETDGSGLLTVDTGDIKTAGIAGSFNSGSPSSSTDPSVFPTSVSISAPNIVFNDNAVNTGSTTFYWIYPGNHSYYPYYYAASFSATASSTLSSGSNNTTADINAYTVSLNGPSIGTTSHPVEVGSGATLNINNTGGSTYVKSVDNTFTSVNMTHVKTSGTHSILFSSGDHLDYTTNGSGVILPTLGARSDGSTLAASTGIDTTGSDRSVSITANSGYIEFDTNSVNTDGGSFTTTIYSGNTDRNSGKAIYAKNAKDGSAEITASTLYFNNYNSSGGSMNDIEIAKGGSNSTDQLTVNTYGGNVDLTELTTNHFKYLNVTLNGASTAQNVAIDLAGADDVNFSDSGSLVTIDATKVNVSSNNRHWYLYTPSRIVQINGNSLGTGNYTVNGGAGLALNSDVLTNGGTIALTGGSSYGIRLLQSVRVDSNADDTSNSTSTGSAGTIQMSGAVSATSTGRTLTLDSSSTTTSGGTIQMYSTASNGGGAYLAGLTLTGKGSTNTNDGAVYLTGSSYLLNGNFSSTGNTILNGGTTTIDTEQGNTASGGNITFAGYDLYMYPYYAYTFNTATTAAGMNGGNVNLYGTYQHSTVTPSSLTVTSTAGSGGTAGSITLPAVTTDYYGSGSTQSYTGGVITLNGNLQTNGGNVTLAGDTQLANSVTIDTWSSTSASAYGSQQTRGAGSVTISGTGVSATSASKNLTIDTSTNTGSGYYNPPTNTQQWTHSGGNVSVIAGNAGGSYVNALTVTTTKGGTYNTGSDGTMTLNGVSTTGNQTYTGGTATVAGDLLTNGGNINLSGVSSLAFSGTSRTLDTDMTGGSSNAGTLNLGSHNLNGAVALTIDTSADGGGTGTDLTLPLVGNSTALTSLDAKAKTLTVSGNITAGSGVTLRATNAILLSSDATINTSGSNGNIAINAALDSSGSARALTLNAGTGTATFASAVGGSSALSSLSTTASTIAVNGGSVTTTGAQTYTGNVTLGANTTLTTTNSAVSFGGKVNSSGANRALTTSTGSGTTTFANTVGDTLALASLTTGDAAINTSAITTTGAQTYGGNVVIGASTTLTTTDSNVSFNGTVNDSSTNAHSLEVAAGSGTVTFGDAVGAVRGLSGVYVTGPTVIDANMTFGRAEFYSPVTLTSDVTLVQNCCYGAHFHSTVDGAYALNLNATYAMFDGAIGGSTPLTSLSVTGAARLNANVTTTGAQTYNDDVSLIAANITLTQTGANTDFTLPSDVAITNNTGIDANLTINTTGDIVLASNSEISSTTGALNVTLRSDSDTSGAGGISLLSGASVSANGGAITLQTDSLDIDAGTLSSSGALTIRTNTAGTTIGIAGGSGTLALSAANLNTNIADGFSSITIGHSSAGAITVGGATTVNDNLVLVSGGNINIDAALNASGQTVTLTGGSGATVSGSGDITATSLLLNGSGATYTLNTASANSVGTLAATGVAAVNFKNSGSLAVGSVGGVNGVSASGGVTIEANGASADITLDEAVTSTGGDIVLAAGRNFINNETTDTGINAGSGRYFVYSANPAASTEGMTGYSKHYNQTYVAGTTPSYATSGNWFLYSVAPVISVTPNSVTVDQGATATFTPTYSGFIDGDASTTAGISGTAVYHKAGTGSSAGLAETGTHNVEYASGLVSSLGYAFQDNATSIGELTVNAAATTNNSTDNITSSITATQTGINGTADTSSVSGTVQQPLASAVTSNVIQPGAGVNVIANVGSNQLVIDSTASGGMLLSTPSSSSPISLTEHGNTLTLSFGTAARDTTGNTSSVLPVFSSENTGLVAQGSFNVVDKGSALSIVATGVGVNTVPDVSQRSRVTATAMLNLPDGSVARMTVSVSAEGVLFVSVPAGAATRDQKQIVALGIAAAKESLDISLGDLKAVVVEKGGLVASN